MSKRGGSGSDRRQEFLKSIEKQKLDTVRWSLMHGGQTPATRDDDGDTAVMIAAGKGLRKVMQVMLELLSKQRELDTLNLTDGEGGGRTAVMMAATNGHLDLVKDLVDAGANWKMKCSDGKTAEDYAKAGGHAHILAYLSRGCESSEGEEEEDDGFDGDAHAIDGESASQRRKRIKNERAAASTKGRAGLKAVRELKAEDSASDDEDEDAGNNEPALWEEVAKALKDPHVVQLSIDKRSEASSEASVIDPALWRCKHVNSLVLRIGPPLIALPEKGPELLVNLRSLIVSHNGLLSLPDSLCSLPLKVLEAEGNALTSLPASFTKLQTLETLQLSLNKLTSEGCGVLKACKNLVTLSLDCNAITDISCLSFDKLLRLNLLTLRSNKIEEIPDEIGQCASLSELGLSGNLIEDVPSALGNLKEKKVRVIDLSGNPLSDPKIRKMMDKSGTFVKELLTYLRKGGGGGGGKGKKQGKGGKKAKKVASSEDEDEEEEEECAQVPKEADTPPAPSPAPTPAPAPEPAAAVAGKKLSKKEMLKEREKADRRVAEEAMKTKAVAMTQAAMDAVPMSGANDDDDDELGWEAPKKGGGGGGGGGGHMYSLTPAQLKELEAKESKAREEERLQKESEEAKLKMSKEEEQAARAEQRMRELALKDKKVGDHYTWEFLGGQLVKKHMEAGQQPRLQTAGSSKLPTNAYSVTTEIPSLILGRVIGKGGENIKATEAKSGARVRILQAGEAKLATGMAGVHVSGTHSSIESARALINKNLA